MYSVLAGRYARAFIGVREGRTVPDDSPPSIEDIANLGQYWMELNRRGKL